MAIYSILQAKSIPSGEAVSISNNFGVWWGLSWLKLEGVTFGQQEKIKQQPLPLQVTTSKTRLLALDSMGSSANPRLRSAPTRCLVPNLPHGSPSKAAAMWDVVPFTLQGIQIVGNHTSRLITTGINMYNQKMLPPQSIQNPVLGFEVLGVNGPSEVVQENYQYQLCTVGAGAHAHTHTHAAGWRMNCEPTSIPLHLRVCLMYKYTI